MSNIFKNIKYLFEDSNNIDKFCNKYKIKNYKINEDGSIDVNQNVDLGDHRFNSIPIKFNRVNGNFDISYNRLTTLENSPKYVSGDFDCSYNNLTTLKEGPIYVSGKYLCDENKLVDTYGFPEAFKSSLRIYGNPVNEIIDLHLDIKFVKFLNEYQVIRNGNIIIEDRLKEALASCGKKFKPVKFKYYKLS